MRKSDEQAIETSTWNKVADNEPVFILRAQDVFAASAVRYWADLAEKYGTDQSKVSNARALANQMEQWQKDFHRRKLPD